MTLDELAEFLVNGGGWRLAWEQRDDFQRETARQEAEHAERAARAQQQREPRPPRKRERT